MPRANAFTPISPLMRINIALTLLLAALLWLSHLLEPAQSQPPLLNIEAHTVGEINVQRQGKIVLSLLRDKDGWMLTHPDVGRASDKRVGQLLSLTRMPALTPLPDAQPAQFGLAPPRLLVAFDQQLIAFGESSVPGGQRYALVDGKVYLVDDAYYRIAGLPGSHFLE